MKLQHLSPLILGLGCAPQQELDPLYPEKPAVVCPSKLEARIHCMKGAIAQTGALADAESHCEGPLLLLCQIDVMQKYGNDFRLHEDPLDSCASAVSESGTRTVDLQCLLGNFSVMSKVQSDIRADLKACTEGVLLCYERVYSQL